MESLQPREKLVIHGVDRLSDAELLAVILGTGGPEQDAVALAGQILVDCGDLRALAELHPSEMKEWSGLGPAKSARLAAALELGLRVCTRRWELGEPFRDSRQVFDHLHQRLRGQKRECFLVLLLDARNRLLAELEVSWGSLVASIVHPREVFRPAIQHAANSVLFVHNHPSGDPHWSQDDLEITRRLYHSGELLGIEVLDHVIIGDGSYCSFVDEGLPPFV